MAYQLEFSNCSILHFENSILTTLLLRNAHNIIVSRKVGCFSVRITEKSALNITFFEVHF